MSWSHTVISIVHLYHWHLIIYKIALWIVTPCDYLQAIRQGFGNYININVHNGHTIQNFPIFFLYKINFDFHYRNMQSNIIIHDFLLKDILVWFWHVWGLIFLNNLQNFKKKSNFFSTASFLKCSLYILCTLYTKLSIEGEER